MVLVHLLIWLVCFLLLSRDMRSAIQRFPCEQDSRPSDVWSPCQHYMMKRWARNLDFFVWFSYICLYEYFAFSYLVVTCAAPSNVSHANKIPDQAMYHYLANITYICNIGYEHSSGDLNRTCTATDTWSGTAPACTSMWQYLGPADKRDLTTFRIVWTIR